MLMLLGLSLPCGFVTSTATSLSSEIQKLNNESSLTAAEIRKQIDDLWSTFGADGELDVPKNEETRHKVSLLRNRLQTFITCWIRCSKKQLLSVVTFQSYSYEPGSLTPVPKLSTAQEDLRIYYLSRRDVTQVQQKALIRSSILTGYILPVLLGAMGSCAYVIRLISDQIKDTTFSSSSPIRHIVRVALGALARVVIGYSGLVAGSLSGAALSFIAGYAVEPVFATFDSIAQKFR